MIKNLKKIERIIGIMLIVFGTYILFVKISECYLYFNILKEQVQTINLVYYSLYESIFPILVLIGGILLLRSNKIGWLLSLFSSVCVDYFLISNSIRFIQEYNLVQDSNYKAVIIIGILLLAIIFLIISIILLNKAFREKYKPSIFNLIVLLILMCFVIFRNYISV